MKPVQPEAMKIIEGHSNREQQSNESSKEDNEPSRLHEDHEDEDRSETTNLTRLAQQEQIIDLVEKRDKDLDSLDGLDQEKKQIHDVYVQDEVLETSSIMYNTVKSKNSNFSDWSEQTRKSDNQSRNSKTSINQRTIENLVEEGMTDEDIRARVHNFQQHQMRKSENRASMEVEEFIKRKNHQIKKCKKKRKKRMEEQKHQR